MDFVLDKSEFEISFFQSSGPGGQNVNKVATAVRVAWRVADTKRFEGERKSYLLSRLSSQLDSDGVLAVVRRQYRTQNTNLTAALERMHEIVAKALERPKKRRPTKPTKGSIERRLSSKKRHAELKNSRRVQD